MAQENKIEVYFVETVRKAGGLAVKFAPIFYAGFPDRLLFMPEGVFVLVELKAPGKLPRPLQARVHDKLRKLGFRVEVIDSREAVDAFMQTLC